MTHKPGRASSRGKKYVVPRVRSRDFSPVWVFNEQAILRPPNTQSERWKTYREHENIKKNTRENQRIRRKTVPRVKAATVRSWWVSQLRFLSVVLFDIREQR